MDQTQGGRAMHVICPECDARYDVRSDLIPAGGREVECSACAAVWEERPRLPAGAEDPDKTQHRARRTVTPEVADILRSEAAREQAARKAKSGPMATDGAVDGVGLAGSDDPGAMLLAMLAEDEIDDGRRPKAGDLSVPSAELRPAERPATQKAERRTEHPAPVASTDPVAPLEDLPGAGDKVVSPTTAAEKKITASSGKESSGRGWRAGLWVIILVACVMALAHIFAPRIIAAVPAAEPAVTAYTEGVERARAWAIQRLAGLKGGSGPEAATGE
jgi:predicted Zn finger-like uncharacterized protein